MKVINDKVEKGEKMKKFKIDWNGSDQVDIAAAKSTIRDLAKGAHEKIDLGEKERREGVITERLTAMKEYKEANVVLVYLSNKFEVSTRRFLEVAWQDSKIVGVPKCDKETGTMAFYAINSYQDIKTDESGFSEPSCKVLLTDFSHSICIVPALVFDYKGYRIGYGSGFYDRFLVNYPWTKIGIALSTFVQRAVPKEDADIGVDYIVTEKFTKRVGKAPLTQGMM
ncbi:MAG: 5-formyltetrahydrofolate cyclo-ligase [Oscillospiraceae bacterium]|nr:5-formyltetrahydrofolate cyclo-ligase [Oscillospiraceae bacterium]